MVSLSNHELVAVRWAHREAMGDIVFQRPARHTGAAFLAEILCPICVLTGGEASDIDSFLSQSAENG